LIVILETINAGPVPGDDCRLLSMMRSRLVLTARPEQTAREFYNL